MDNENKPIVPRVKDAERIGLLGVFVSPTLESAFRRQRFREDQWLIRLLVIAGALRVALFVLADFRDFGVGRTFWLLFASRFLFLLVSVGVLVAVRQAPSPARADRLFFCWGILLGILTVYALSTRPPSNHELLLVSFSLVLCAYCITPLTLSRQAVFALSYSAAVLIACRRVNGVTLSTVGVIYAMSHLFGVIASWHLNHRRREAFLATLREAELRARLEAALAEVRTLRGQLCICAWCKRIRDEAESWDPVEKYVQNRTHASFSHGICPECLQSQVEETARSLR